MALTNPQEIIEFASAISRCADSIHARLLSAINNKEVDQNQAQTIFQYEIGLRQYANSLYTNALKLIVGGLQVSQNELIELVETANNQIQTIEQIAVFVDLVADLVMLAVAAYSTKPDMIIAAVFEVGKDVKSIYDSNVTGT
ncbi:hypothetical protein [Nitrosomonas ureae]|uniref:Uncharacterized protein n=1 Tax=Nitrosomonas ureae TaxID=44577 RepID=A0A1H2G3C8_9PROT|nr:hypothetical protein [Nitrosomonas ureae]ALQ52152.1 hypothetical protein ATY38_13600 [Nitrosomonas ureae]SDU14065.1 hypothetical protein SAMN05216406_12742 [Nitrosomonas ureae]